jgi:hypothetical protein
MSFFVGDFIGKLITNKIIVQIQIKNFINKYKDCDSDKIRTYICFHKQKKLILLV